MTHIVTLEEKDHKKVQVTWDDVARAAYIRLFVGKVAKTREITPGVVADFSSSGKLLGLEILNPEAMNVAAFKSAIKRLKAAVPFNPAALPQLFPAKT